MNYFIKIFMLFVLLISCSENNLSLEQSAQDLDEVITEKSVFGKDDRIESINENSPFWQNQKLSIAAVISEENLVLQDDYYNSLTYNLRDQNYCGDTPFIDQEVLPKCTGFLIDENTILTAGHCMAATYHVDPFGQKTDIAKTEEQVCKETHFAFDYDLESELYIKGTIHKDSVYSCAKVTKLAFDEGDFNAPDFAIIKLDRPVLNRPFVKFNFETNIKNGDPLSIIGHPQGLPMKVAHQGKVIATKELLLETTVDALNGNSGSPVFHSTTGLVEGILVSGPLDDGKGFWTGCSLKKKFDIFLKCRLGGNCNKVTRISEIIKYLD